MTRPIFAFAGGTVDYEAAIAEFRRQWGNFERGGKFLKERGEAQEAHDREVMQERGWMGDEEGAARFEGETASADQGGLNPVTGLPRVFDEQGAEILFSRGAASAASAAWRRVRS